jgi:thiopurine S-methyltransferase
VASALMLRSMSSSTPPPTDRIARWTEKWDGPVQGWQLPQPHALLLKYSDTLLQQPEASAARTPQPRTVLFPLCGADPSLGHLARQGHSVVGVDGVAKAIDQLMGEYGDEMPARQVSTLSGSLAVRISRPPAPAASGAPGVTTDDTGPSTQAEDPAVPLVAVQADFLLLDPPTASALGVGSFDAVFDRGALVAVAPGDRERYADVLAGLVRRGGRVLFVGVEHDCKSPEGPPFAVDDDEVSARWDAVAEWKGEKRFMSCLALCHGSGAMRGSERRGDSAPPTEEAAPRACCYAVYVRIWPAQTFCSDPPTPPLSFLPLFHSHPSPPRHLPAPLPVQLSS